MWGDLAVVHAKLIPVARGSSANTFMSLRFGSRRTLLLKVAQMGGVAHNFLILRVQVYRSRHYCINK